MKYFKLVVLLACLCAGTAACASGGRHGGYIMTRRDAPAGKSSFSALPN